MPHNRPFGFYEFFAGGGMARLGLGRKWRGLFANDWCEKKAAAYRLNFGPSPELLVKDVRHLTVKDLPECPTLAWASFPCQDLSLAGNGHGLKGGRSGTFWPFWNLMRNYQAHGNKVPLMVVENVAGAITTNQGKDFKAILNSMVAAGYRVGPMVIDAAHFLPQSRPRLFILAVGSGFAIEDRLTGIEPHKEWHPKSLISAYEKMPSLIQESWVWWNLPMPPRTKTALNDLIDEEPTGVSWHSQAETRRLLEQMSQGNRDKVRAAQALGIRTVGTVYRRTRPDENGQKVQRAEVRFDQTSGCLRTPVGGSSRQIILEVQGSRVHSRLLSPREAARLMGVHERYKLPENYNEAYHLMGDGVVVPVVSWLEKHLLSPLATQTVVSKAA